MRKQKSKEKINKGKKSKSKSKSRSKSSKSKSNKKTKKTDKSFVFPKEPSEGGRSSRYQEYPIGKYVNLKKNTKTGLSIKIGIDNMDLQSDTFCQKTFPYK